MGPVDIVVIGFPPDAPPTGESIPLVIDLATAGSSASSMCCRSRRDGDGTIAELEINELGAHVEVFQGASTGMIGSEDAAVAGEGLEPGEAAVLLCFENSWAAPFVTSVMRNGGRVLGFERIPAEDLIETLQALEAAE